MSTRKLLRIINETVKFLYGEKDELTDSEIEHCLRTIQRNWLWHRPIILSNQN